MPRPKIRPVSPDEVKITREGDTAVFTYADETTMGGGMHVKMGEKLHKMTDADLLKMHNEMAENILAARHEYDHVAVEVPPGLPQVEYDAQCETWSPKGDVLRCCIGYDPDHYNEPMVEIDDKKLTWKEFGKMLMTHEGWGMRLVLMPDDEMHKEPDFVKAESREKYMEENPQG